MPRDIACVICRLRVELGGRGNVKAAGQQGQSAGPGLGGRGGEDEVGAGW